MTSNPLDRDNLRFPTSHLTNYDYLESVVKLQGDEYDPVKKALWYQIHSMPFRKTEVKAGDISHDCRVHLAVPLESGGGKKNIINTLEDIFKPMVDYKTVRPTSYHPEQLVGKTVKEGKKNATFRQLTGHLDTDLLILDEAKDLFEKSGDKVEASRSYLNEALDPYGTNTITKRRTEIPEKKALSYTPDVNASVFFQPFHFDQEVLLEGTLRRFLIPYSNFPAQPKFKGYSKRLRGGSGVSRDKALGEIRKNLNDLADYKRNQINLKSDSLDKFEQLHQQLVYQGFSFSEKGKNLTRIIDFHLQDILLKMAGIQALVHKRNQIETVDVERAYIDLAELLACLLEFAENKLKGNFDYGDDWTKSRKQDRVCLEWLEKQEATSKQTSQVSIQEYKKKIAETCDLSDSGAQNRYNKHKQKGWIASSQTGQHESKVWLTVDRGDSLYTVNFYREELKPAIYEKICEDILRDEGSKGSNQTDLSSL